MTKYHAIIYGSIAAAIAVIFGAFGAHALKPHLSDYQIGIYQTGIQYQFIHALAMLVIGNLLPKSRAALFFIIGIFCFSGSLYLLACRDLIPLSVAIAGPITPIGGVCFIAGWITFIVEYRQYVKKM